MVAEQNRATGTVYKHENAKAKTDYNEICLWKLRARNNCASVHFRIMSFFFLQQISIRLLYLPLFVLEKYERHIKYKLLSAPRSPVLSFGIALLFSNTERLSAGVSHTAACYDSVLVLGFVEKKQTNLRTDRTEPIHRTHTVDNKVGRMEKALPRGRQTSLTLKSPNAATSKTEAPPPHHHHYFVFYFSLAVFLAGREKKH